MNLALLQTFLTCVQCSLQVEHLDKVDDLNILHPKFGQKKENDFILKPVERTIIS